MIVVPITFGLFWYLAKEENDASTFEVSNIPLMFGQLSINLPLGNNLRD